VKDFNCDSMIVLNGDRMHITKRLSSAVMTKYMSQSLPLFWYTLTSMDF